MTEQVWFTPARVFSESADLEPGAKAYFYESGTTTRLPVYTSETLSVEHPVPLVADALGIFPQVFTGGARVKVIVKDSDGVTLDGYPIDPAVTTTTDTAANLVAFTPSNNNEGTNVQAAIDNNSETIVGHTRLLVNSARTPATGGSDNAYTLTPIKTAPYYASGDEYSFVVDRANTDAVTLNVSGLGPKAVKRFDETATLVALASGDWKQGEIHTVVYDGTQMRLKTPIGATETTRGIVEAATTAEAEAGIAAGKFPDVVKVMEAISAMNVIKARGCINGTAGSPAATGAQNIASITKHGTGDYGINFTTDMDSTAYQVAFSPVENGADGRCFHTHARAVGSVRIRTETATGTAADFDFTVVIFEG